MLYKNLPEKELIPVLRIRKILDYVAALTFLLKGEKDSAVAVFKARKDFRKILPSFATDRKEIQNKALLHPVPERISRSLLWRYYVGRKKTFDKVMK